MKDRFAHILLRKLSLFQDMAFAVQRQPNQQPQLSRGPQPYSWQLWCARQSHSQPSTPLWAPGLPVSHCHLYSTHSSERCPYPWQGGWNWLIFKISSNPNHSVILFPDKPGVLHQGPPAHGMLLPTCPRPATSHLPPCPSSSLQMLL